LYIYYSHAVEKTPPHSYIYYSHAVEKNCGTLPGKNADSDFEYSRKVLMAYDGTSDYGCPGNDNLLAFLPPVATSELASAVFAQMRLFQVNAEAPSPAFLAKCPTPIVRTHGVFSLVMFLQ
jgi:hypothetical protein